MRRRPRYKPPSCHRPSVFLCDHASLAGAERLPYLGRVRSGAPWRTCVQCEHRSARFHCTADTTPMTRRHARCTGVADEARYLPLIVPAMRHPRGRGAFPAGAALDAAARGVVHGAALRYRPRPAVYRMATRTGNSMDTVSWVGGSRASTICRSRRRIASIGGLSAAVLTIIPASPISACERSAVFGRRARLQPVPEGGGGRGQPPRRGCRGPWPAALWGRPRRLVSASARGASPRRRRDRGHPRSPRPARAFERGHRPARATRWSAVQRFRCRCQLPALCRRSASIACGV